MYVIYKFCSLANPIWLTPVKQYVPIPELRSVPYGSAPYIVLGGTVCNVDKDEATWDMHPTFFSMGQIDGGQVTVKAHIPEGPRWKKRDKIIPSNHSIMTQQGPMTDMPTDKATSKPHIEMSIADLCFLGKNTNRSATPTPGMLKICSSIVAELHLTSRF